MNKLRFALTMVSTQREEDIAREYIQQAGYKVLEGSLEFKTSYRSALTAGKTVTETLHKGVNTRADKLLQSIFSTVQDLVTVEDSEPATSQQPDSSYLVESA